MEPDSLLERFAYRNKNKHNTEFLAVKGTKGQLEGKVVDSNDKDVNEQFGFKCLHYSVTESAGHVEISVLRKNTNVKAVGVRTRDDNAVKGKDYEAYDQVLEFDGQENEKKVKIAIINDDEWNPDLDFFVVLYDPNIPSGDD